MSGVPAGAKVTGLVGTYSYGQNGQSPRQLSTITDPAGKTTSFAYNGAGHQTRHGDRQLAFDAFDQLIRVELPGGKRVDYHYGHDGQRSVTRGGPGGDAYFFGPGHIQRNGKREHLLMVGDRAVARVKVPAPDGGADRFAGLVAMVGESDSFASLAATQGEAARASGKVARPEHPEGDVEASAVSRREPGGEATTEHGVRASVSTNDPVSKAFSRDARLAAIAIILLLAAVIGIRAYRRRGPPWGVVHSAASLSPPPPRRHSRRTRALAALLSVVFASTSLSCGGGSGGDDGNDSSTAFTGDALPPGLSGAIPLALPVPTTAPAGLTVTYLHNGVAPGPVLVTDEDGNVISERRYLPFGDILEERTTPPDQTAAAADPLNALNKETDPTTGWSYHGARWMAPSHTRWLSPDPPTAAPSEAYAASPWDLHPYQYARQNPDA